MKPWPAPKLRYVAKLAYGDTVPPDRDENGSVQVFGSNGPFARHSESNTQSPAIIVGRKGSYGKVNWSEAPCFASDTTFFVDSTTTKHDLRWLYWFLHTLRLDSESDDAAVPGLNRETAYAEHVPLPPLPRQRAIAAYLDRETAKIDAMIAAKERLLALLTEKRRALITHAVTRGFNPDSPMKDSGVEWLGEIPEHWHVERLAYQFIERDERDCPELPLLEVSLRHGVILREFSSDKIEGTAADFNTYKVARRGNIVFNKMRMWQGAVGIAPEDGLVSPDYVVAEPIGQVSSGYAGILFRTPAFSAECGRRSYGLVWDRLRLYWEGFKNIRIGIPPLEEQMDIVERMGEASRRFHAFDTHATRSIELLRERRSSLIAAAVTGEIDVKDAA